MSPSKCVVRIENATAELLKLTGTISKAQVLIGPVPRKSKTMAPAKHKRAKSRCAVPKATTVSGTASNVE